MRLTAFTLIMLACGHSVAVHFLAAALALHCLTTLLHFHLVRIVLHVFLLMQIAALMIAVVVII